MQPISNGHPLFEQCALEIAGQDELVLMTERHGCHHTFGVGHDIPCRGVKHLQSAIGSAVASICFTRAASVCAKGSSPARAASSAIRASTFSLATISISGVFFCTV